MRKILTLLFCGCLAMAVFADGEGEKAENLLKHDFSKLDSKGVPVGYKVSFDDASKGKMTVSQEDGTNVVKLEIPEQGKGFIDTNYALDIKENKKYILTIQLKIEEQKYSGKGIHFFYVCVYNTGNGKHIYNKIIGHGSTDGWLTVVLPIDTAKNAELVGRGTKILLRGYFVSGTYSLKKPMLVEIPADLELEAHYILDNNKTIPGGLLRLGTLSE